MRILEGQQILMRIFIDEADKYDNGPLYKKLLQILKDEKIAGATVFRGICGFGAQSHMHTANLLSLSHNLPIVIEVVDSEDKINQIMPKIDDIINQGLITLEKVNVVKYALKEN